MRAFTSAHQMLQHLQAGRADGGAERRLASYLKPHLLVLDDFGLKPLPSSGPVDLCDVVDGRYERGSIVVTSNRAPDEWPELSSDPLLASAALDRLIHRAAVVLISGRSYRLASHDAAREGREGKEEICARPRRRPRKGHPGKVSCRCLQTRAPW